eukprot:TRINITY_DN2110_c0_g1_i3.p1 TRINITY_DN2110_c0_g1~~TRINITY_DN2110_c0_g1_i3.p1  ORF type:complete len:766 (+),score=227.24 TRINITY_DN2110_c0_g1_i3:81-2378(+)
MSAPSSSSSSSRDKGGKAGQASRSPGREILPVEGKRNILITSALPYVNNVPHLGNIIGSTLSADVYARYCRLRGDNVLFICGTDEYGTATEARALVEKLTPREICDKYNAIHTDIYEWFGLSFDKFGRTSTPEQTQIAQHIFKKCHENGELKEQSMEQLYCEGCKKFLADRFVEGNCPHCNFDAARGDQCDQCGKLLDPTELKNPRCITDNSTPVLRTTTHMFLDLSSLQERVRSFVNQSSTPPGMWSANAIQITNKWLNDPLHPRCITRDLKWGIPVPLPGYEDKVLYVWFDAPIGYISITATHTPQWEKWWKNPDQVDLIQFMGKDNVPFHTVVFPASLIGSGENWTKLRHISTTEYLTYQGGKFSKGRNNGVFGNHVRETGIPPEVWRYYLLVNRPEVGDSDFSWSDFGQKNNTELLNALGNLVNRSLKFIVDKFDGRIPPASSLRDSDQAFIESVNRELTAYTEAFDQIHIKEALRLAMGVALLGNKYMQDNKAWELIDSDKERSGTVLNVLANLVVLLVIILEPFIPTFSDLVRDQLRYDPQTLPKKFELVLEAGHEIGVVEPIFRRLSVEEIDDYRKRFSPPEEEAFPADIRSGRVLAAENHKESDHLYVLQIDLGKEKRQIVSGLRAHYPDSNDLVGKNVAVLCNLKAAKFRGVMSQGMILTGEQVVTPASGETPAVMKVGVLRAAAAVPGTIIVPTGCKLEVKQKYDTKEFARLELRVNETGHAMFKSRRLEPSNSLPSGEKDSLVADQGVTNGLVK